jgi:protein-tyrosine kinase
MSRIEQALEKASRIRETEATGAAAPDDDTPPGETGSAPLNPYLVTITDPDSPAAEEYRKLKARVIKGTRQDSSRHSIMVTSCTSGEGKSLMSINLGVSLAQEVSHRALLIDADLRRPSLARYLGIDAAFGLAECLCDGASVSSAIIKTRVPKLDLLPAGKSVRNPVELLSSPKMKSILGDLKRSCPERYLIIDTPPILPFAESQIISLLAEGVLFVVRASTVTAQQLHDAFDILQGTKILGIAFNDVSAPAMNERYQNYYRYYAERQQRQV